MAEKKLGMKWYTFFTKVRPVIIILFFISFLASIKSIIDFPISFSTNVGFTIVFILWIICYVTDVILQIGLMVKSNELTKNTFNYIKIILISDIVIGVCSTFLSYYLEGDSDWWVLIIISVITFLVYYFVWYDCNIVYFEKRLLPQNLNANSRAYYNRPYTNSQSQNNISYSLSWENEVEEKKNRNNFYGSDMALIKDETPNILE